MGMAYNPKTAYAAGGSLPANSVVYITNTPASDRFFIPAYPDPTGTMSQQLAYCQKLSPSGKAE